FVAGSLITLNDTRSVPGPDEFEFAVSWDENLSAGQSFTATLRQTVRVPEPAGSALVALVSLVVLARRRRPSRQVSSP
ncbi:MAG: PEP-CTERM sorting domain-containing protein, partial [Deltaproteobacteria bacterium]|nr:PEP-CTERM sorting domain-containing protein [Deltaproteobacteria bacterium]